LWENGVLLGTWSVIGVMECESNVSIIVVTGAFLSSDFRSLESVFMDLFLWIPRCQLT
jgi:hypothetical protein